MYTEKRIKIHSFQKRENLNIKGSQCAFNEKHFIDYRGECYIHPDLKIIICIKCRNESQKTGELKYHNVKQEFGGYIYDSRFESEFAQQLDLQKRAGLIRDWKRQVKIEINAKFIDGERILTSTPGIELKEQGIKFKHITNYFMDFVVTNNDYSQIFYETKGMETSTWRLKIRLTEILFDEKVKIEVIKKSGYKIKRKEKQR